MQLHKGRLIDHVHLRTRDLGAARRFYSAAIGALRHGIEIVEDAHHFQCDELWIDLADGPVSHVHLAFQADNREMVDRFHRAAIKAGGRDNGAPGERPYHPGYYGAFVLDPDGNNIEAVYHGPAQRSAASVVFTFEMPGK